MEHPITRKPTGSTPVKTLEDLQPGQTAVVTALTSTGLERRRMMDLGIIPGTRVQAEFDSPLGDPTAYKIRGTLVALRRGQAKLVHITTETEEHSA